jgi:TRAP-type C4-dicarboxylate transport system substrate-binding protein
MKHSLTAALMLASTALAAPASAETELSFNIFFPQTHFIWPVFKEWSADVSEATDGEINITFPAQSVSPPPGVMDAVRNGVADGGFVFNGFIAKDAPATLLSQMPWMHKGDSAAMSRLMW